MLGERLMAFVFKPTKGFASKTKVEVEGMDDVIKSLRGLDKESKEPIRSALKELTKKMVAQAKPLTPDDPETAGALRESVRIASPLISRTTGRISAGIVAGGKALEKRLGKRAYSAWALVQHEDLTLKHESGQGKYLEIPFMAHVGKVPQVVREAMDAALADKGTR